MVNNNLSSTFAITLTIYNIVVTLQRLIMEVTVVANVTAVNAYEDLVVHMRYARCIALEFFVFRMRSCNRNKMFLLR